MLLRIHPRLGCRSTSKLPGGNMQVEGAVVLVTGANRGIGGKFVEEVLARGAGTVYAAARHAESVTAADPRVVPVALDVTDPERVQALAGQLTDVTVVVNNAGVLVPDL